VFRRLTPPGALPAVLGGVVGAATAVAILHPGSTHAAVFIGADVLAAVALVVAVALRKQRDGAWQRILRATGDDEDGRSQVDRQAEAALRFVGAEGLALLFPDGPGRLRVGALAGEPPAGLDIGAEVATDHPAVVPLVVARPRRVDHGEDLLGGAPAPVALCLLATGGVATAAVVAWFGRRGPTRSQLWRVRRLARGAAVEIERARLDDAERRSRLGASHARRHLSLLVAATGALSRALEDWEPALEVLAGEIVPFHADFFAVDAVADDGTIQRVVASHIDPALAGAAQHPGPRWATAMAEVLHRGQSVLFPAVLRARSAEPPAELPGGLAGTADELGLDSWAIVPIRNRGLSIGALTVGTVHPRRGLRPSDLNAFEELAERTALALERVLLYRQTQASAASAERNAARLGRAVEAAPAITSSLALVEVAAATARQAARAMGALEAVVTLDRPDRERIVASWPPGGGELGLWLSVPILVPGSAIVGSLEVAVPDGHEFEIEAQAVLRLLAQVAAAAVGHAELYEAAAASERRLRAVVEASPLAILETDPDGRALAWNAAAADLFDWDSATAGALSAATVDLLRGCRRQLENGEAVIDQRAVLTRDDASPVEVAIAAALLGDDSDSLLCVISDVTERQLLEREVQQKRRMEALGRLAGGVAHDFNNLLTVIVGYADLLASRLGEEHPLYRDVDAIRAAGRRASTFTEQLLTISRRRVVQDAVVELNRAVVELEEVLRRLVGEDVLFETDLRPRSGCIRVDVGQLEQVVLNLVINARDAMPDGGVLKVQTHCGDADPDGDGRGWSVLTVTDTGVGMDAVTAERCFEPFFTTRDRGKGTGLGLATVYGIVQQTGGHISVDSAPGEGTSFRIAFPRVDAPADVVPAIPAAPPMEGLDVGHVLLAEDDPDVRSFTRLVLMGAGYSVSAAGGGDEALRLARQLPAPDLLVTDVVMPGMSGPELAVELAVLFPSLPVVFMSGYVEDDPRARAVQEHPHSRFLPKPFGPRELLTAVRDVLGSTVDQGSKR